MIDRTLLIELVNSLFNTWSIFVMPSCSVPTSGHEMSFYLIPVFSFCEERFAPHTILQLEKQAQLKELTHKQATVHFHEKISKYAKQRKLLELVLPSKDYCWSIESIAQQVFQQ